MALSDKAEIERFDVVDVISSRHDCGYGDVVIMGFLWGLLGKQLSDEEIADYAEAVEPDEEAREAIVEDLKQWRAVQGGEGSSDARPLAGRPPHDEQGEPCPGGYCQEQSDTKPLPVGHSSPSSVAHEVGALSANGDRSTPLSDDVPLACGIALDKAVAFCRGDVVVDHLVFGNSLPTGPAAPHCLQLTYSQHDLSPPQLLCPSQ